MEVLEVLNLQQCRFYPFLPDSLPILLQRRKRDGSNSEKYDLLALSQAVEAAWPYSTAFAPCAIFKPHFSMTRLCTCFPMSPSFAALEAPFIKRAGTR
jgi:hypothetical protein